MNSNNKQDATEILQGNLFGNVMCVLAVIQYISFVIPISKVFEVQYIECKEMYHILSFFIDE